MDDQFLIKQTLAGNTNAFKFIVLRYQRPIFKFLGAFQLGPSLTEEIAQEAFLKVFKNLSSYDSSKGASVSSWIFTIARNLAINELNRHHHDAEVYSDKQDGGEITEVPSMEPTIEEQLDTRLAEVRLTEALTRVPLLFRTAMILSFFKDLSVEEISKIEGCSVGTVKSRVHRGKQMLRAALLRKEGV